MTFLLRVFQFVVGCHHSDMSRVFTIKKRSYRVCVACGREFEYLWALMHSMGSNVGDNTYPRLRSAMRA